MIESFILGARSMVLCVYAACCLAVAAGLVHLGHTLPGAGRPDEELMYFPSGRFLKEASLGHEMVIADMAWLRAIQYYGRHKQTDQDYAMAGHIFDVVTTLDPRFRNAYVFGGLVLAQDAGDIQRGIGLLRKGMANLPDEWLLPFEAGFISYLCNSDMAEAHKWFMEAASKPGHPESVERFAAFCAARSGDLETALRLWIQLYESTENDYVRQMAEERIKDILEKMKVASGDRLGQKTQPNPSGARLGLKKPGL